MNRTILTLAVLGLALGVPAAVAPLAAPLGVAGSAVHSPDDAIVLIQHKGGAKAGGASKSRNVSRGGGAAGNVNRNTNVNRNANRSGNKNVNRNVNQSKSKSTNVNRNTKVNRNTNVNRNVNVNRGLYTGRHVYSGGVWVRPTGYWWPVGGAIAAGAAVGFVTAAAATAYADTAPGPNYCWYYSDSSRQQGFWDNCP